MGDVHNTEQRSANMRAIRNKDTKPEMQIRRLLFARGFRFRLHVKSLPGSPDIVLPKHRVAVFVHGCFWHGHGCHLFKIPASRTEFWTAKIQGNRDRDYKHQEKLLAAGWRVLTIWECAIKGNQKRSTEEVSAQIGNWILSRDTAVPHFMIRHL
ncbi:MAG: very short patch repair endonuclease [Pseudomonadota bacterium]